MHTVDAALQHTCASFREQADRGEITPVERDLLIDGAIMLAVHLEDLAQDALSGRHQVTGTDSSGAGAPGMPGQRPVLRAV